MELKKYKLGEVLDVRRGASLAGKYYSNKGKYVRLTCGNFDYNNNCFKENTSKDDLFYVGDVRPEFIMEKGDIITPLTEQAIGLLGSTALIPESGKYIQSQDIAKIECKATLDKNFAFYLISSDVVKKQLSAAAQQTKIRHTSPDKIKDCTVWLPNIETQRQIGNLLSSLDRKIALNRAINRNLEAMAKQLYDYWFVQFDFPDENGRPYKSSGGKMVWSEKLKREIPEGWHCGNLLEIATFTNGLACQKFRPQNGEKGLPVVKIREMHDGITAETERVSENIPESIKVYNGDVLFSWSASLEVMLWAYGTGGLNQHIFKVTSANGNPKSFYYYQLLDYVSVFKQMADARKTTMGHITQDHLEQSTIAIPNDNHVTLMFEELINPLFEKMVNQQESITSLTKLRDELLPLLMSGQVEVAEAEKQILMAAENETEYVATRHTNSDLHSTHDIGSSFSYVVVKTTTMMYKTITNNIVNAMRKALTTEQIALLRDVLNAKLAQVIISERQESATQNIADNQKLKERFIAAKRVEGCSSKTLDYYEKTISHYLDATTSAIVHQTTDDVRDYLVYYQETSRAGKVTIDNVRRILSSFFAWLEDEDYIAKSPVRRIHKVKTDSLVKDVLADEQLEQLRDACTCSRDLALVDFLASTGVRVGELVLLNRNDIDFNERQCVVYGKGGKERLVYFNARAKLHLQNYLSERTDDNPALFISNFAPFGRLTINGVEKLIRRLGLSLQMPKVHPHKFRRTLATMAIDKEMPIEQVQRLLGHVRIDTTLRYAIVNQNNVKMAHKKYIG